MGDYIEVYAELEDENGRTWKSQSITIEWRDQKPIGDFQAPLLSGPGGGDWAGVLVPVFAAIFVFIAARQAWLSIITYVVAFVSMMIFLDVSVWIIILNILAGIGVAIIGGILLKCR